MGCCGIIIWSLLLWTTSILALQILEFFYGTYMATEVAYYTYMYAKVDKANYIKVTSYTRVAMLIGKLIASISGQALIYFSLMDYRDLNYITLAGEYMYVNGGNFPLFRKSGKLLVNSCNFLFSI